MNRFVGEELGRIVVIHLKRGEKLPESIIHQLSELGIKDAVVLCGIGSMQKGSFHVAGSTAPRDEPVYTHLDNTWAHSSRVRSAIFWRNHSSRVDRGQCRPGGQPRNRRRGNRSSARVTAARPRVTPLSKKRGCLN
jgi:hypothetical protein